MKCWCWLGAAVENRVIEDMEERRTPLARCLSIPAPSRALGNGVLLPYLPEHYGEETFLDYFSGSVAVSSVF